MENNDELKINWFPGHMASALRMIADQLKLCDAIIYVLDARCALSSLNPRFDQLVERRPVLFVLNKADLAPPNVLSVFLQSDEIKKVYQRKADKVHTITLDSTTSGSTKRVIAAVEKILAPQINAAKAKGISKTIRSIVIGVTNCGKSTLINNLANKGKTVTGDRPGVTKTKQWVAAGTSQSQNQAINMGSKPSKSFYVLDTPGTLFPALDNQRSIKNLAYVGSIRDDVIDFVALAKHLIADLESLSTGSVHKRFTLATDTDENLFTQIAKKRGYVLKGGVIDEERCAKAILTEFRAGKIGRFNLDEAKRD